MEWGVTDTGFYAPSYSEILSVVQEQATLLYGTELNFSKRTFNGLYFRLIAWFGAVLFKIAEGVYYSGFVSTAYGASLFLLGKYIGIQRLEAQRAIGEVTLKGSYNMTIPSGFLVQTQANVRFATLESVTVPSSGSGEVTIPIRAVYAGADGNVAAGTINKVTNPPPLGGIAWVKNEKLTSGGRNRESEDEFRDRYEKSVDLPGGSNTDAIRAELLRIESIKSAKVFENDTDYEDDNGLPPHSVEAVVQGGLDNEIRRAIFDRKAAGIQTHGTISGIVTDLSGIDKTIWFTRPTDVPVWVKISNLELAGDSSIDIKSTIVRTIIENIGGVNIDGSEEPGLGIGVDVVYNHLICPINQIDGVLDYVLTLSSDGVSYSAQNIHIDIRELARTDPAKIEVA